MPGQFTFHQSGDGPRGRVQRRADRHQQEDPRGQYPRPRSNQFAQPKREIPRRPMPMPEQRPRRQPPEDVPSRDVFTDGDAQYEQPKTPYVPGYMQPSVRQGAPVQPEAVEMPVQQEEYIRRQNPYVVVSEKPQTTRPVMKRRTLLLLILVAGLILAGTWVSGLVFSGQTESVLLQRAAAQEAIAQKHPFGFRELIEREAYANNLHPAFVAAIVLNESSFNPSAESYRGARGLMQVMPDTAQWVFGRIGGAAEYSFDLMYNADLNVTYGCWYLAYLSNIFNGDPALVAAAFHSGQTNVQNWVSNADDSADQQTLSLANLPEGNTKDYVEKVIKAFAAYRRLYYEEVTL